MVKLAERSTTLACIVFALLAACSGDPEIASTLPYEQPEEQPAFTLPARVFISPNLTPLEREAVRLEVAYMNRWLKPCVDRLFIDAAEEGEYGDFTTEDCAAESMLFVSTTSREELGGFGGRAQTGDCRMNVRVAVPTDDFPLKLLHELYHSITDDFHSDDLGSIMHSPIEPGAVFTQADFDKGCRLAKYWSAYGEQ